MKLPVPAFLDKIQKKEKQNYYLALLLRDEKAIALVLEEIEGQIKFIGRAEQTLTQAIEDIPYEELLAILDKTISQAEETLPPQVQTENTILGVKESWVEDKKIKKEYLTKLKKVCDSLSLSPIGFMVVSEAIAHLLQQDEGAPLSAILAEVGKKNVTLSLFRAGKLVESHHREIDGHLPQVVDKLLHHFTTTVLPSRIILFSGGDDDLGQEFIAHQWSHGLPFLHVPQIAVLPTEFDGKAMIVGVAEQLGFTVSGELGETKLHDLGTSQGSQEAISEKEHDGKEDSDDESSEDDGEKEDQELTPIEHTPKETATAAQFGFVVGEDITKVDPSIEDESHQEREEEVHAQTVPSHNTHKSYGAEHDNLRLPKEESHHDSLAMDEAKEQSEKKLFLSSLPLGRITSFLPKGLPSLPKMPLTLPATIMGSKALIALPIFLLIIGGVLYFYFFQLGATITLSVQPQVVRENEAVTLAAGQSNNFSNGTLAARVVEISLEGEEKAQATGKKEVGEKAKGTVTLFNSSDSRRTLAKGTTLTTQNDLEFVTEDEVTISSASGDIFSGIKSGQTKVNVVAKEIGQEYNMPSNTRFSISGSTTLAGRNESAFSGGSKRNVTVISQKDITTLSQALPKKLEEQAKKELAGKVQGGEAVLGVFTDVSVDDENTSHKVGDEAKEVTLKATITYKTLSYKESDIAELAKNTLLSTNANNLTLSDRTLKTKLSDVEVESEDEVSTSVEMEGGLLPSIKQQEIAQNIKGKSFETAKDYLAGLPQVKSAEIKLSPNLPFLPKFLPRKADNITVEVVSNE